MHVPLNELPFTKASTAVPLRFTAVGKLDVLVATTPELVVKMQFSIGVAVPAPLESVMSAGGIEQVAVDPAGPVGGVMLPMVNVQTPS